MSGGVLLIGGSGLLGSAAARALVGAGHPVTVLTRGARALPAGVRALLVDRTDGAAISGALAGLRFDLVVDLLGYTSADVARLFAVPGLRPARYVLVSTGQVYLVAAEPSPPFREADAGRPAAPEPEPGTRDHANWVYGMGKRGAERAALEATSRHGVACTILRLPVVHGAHDSTRRLWSYLQRLRDGGPLLLPGPPGPVRFVWAEDVARALVALAGGLAPRSPAYNLAQPDEPDLEAFLGAAARLLGVTPRFVRCTWEDLAGAGLDESVSVFSGRWCSRPDPSLAARELGLRCAMSSQWLPEVVRAHLAEAAPEPHPGYASRAAEVALAARLSGGA